MLVLSRRPGERITIGQSIELVVLSIEGGRIKLGINAPSQHRILRAEKLAGAARSGVDAAAAAGHRRDDASGLARPMRPLGARRLHAVPPAAARSGAERPV